MSNTRVELPVEQLKIGFYVTSLDRPWEETPFLFQGFEIGDTDQLQMLRDTCKWVTVDIPLEEARALSAVARTVCTSAPPPAPVPKVFDSLLELSTNLSAQMHKVPARDEVPLKTELTLAASAYGEARQTLTKVFDRLRSGGGIEVPQLEGVVDSMVSSIFRNRDAMGWLARLKTKDGYLYSHSLSSSVWALAFGRHLGLDKSTLRAVGTGAMLLDVGKMRLSDDLLRKSGKPTAAEWQEIQEHVEYGMELLRDSAIVDHRIVTMVEMHHERYDGSGYPRQLKGEEIPLIGRIAGIVDSYDAMISERTYAKAKSTYDAVRELKALGDGAFAAELVELFIQAVGVFPTGTLIELNTGEVGIVVAQNRFRRLRPEVMLILDAGKNLRDEFMTVDLLTCDENSNGGRPGLWIVRGLERGAYGIDPTEYFL
jgi:HD-GYP domain-containing protein (c-di-GMP phosphodiesterase class II)